MRSVRHTKVAAGTTDVFDIELLSEALRELLRDQARGDVGHAASREWHDDLHGAIRVACRRRGRSQSNGQRGVHRKQPNRTRTAECAHELSPPNAKSHGASAKQGCLIEQLYHAFGGAVINYFRFGKVRRVRLVNEPVAPGSTGVTRRRPAVPHHDRLLDELTVD